jgi:DNA gyrase subunit A
MQTVFGINMVALVDGQPRLLNVKQILEAFLRHRREVVTRRTVFELRKARDRAHILEGLAVALANIDEIIALIKASAGPAEAREALLARPWQPGIVSEMLARAEGHAYQPEDLTEGLGMGPDGYRLSPTQAQAILDLRLHRLTGLEQDKIIEEYKLLLADIDRLLAILGSSEELMRVVREELLDVRERYNDPRRSEIIVDSLDLTLEDLITPQDVVVTLSQEGYAKTQPISSYEAQRRGGKGRSATRMKDEDFIDKLFIANTHDTLLCFSSRGKCYWLKVYELPQGSRAARGRPIVNLLPLEPEERISAVLPIKEFDDQHYVFMATSRGTVKKTPLVDFSRPRSNGIIAVDLRDDDVLVNVGITDGERDVMLFTDGGLAMRFHESAVRAMGRTAAGVRGIRLQDDQQVIQLLILGEGTILTATENGFGKRTVVDEYPVRGRGGMGVISIRTSERNGKVVAASQVADEDEVMLITRNGTLVRTRASEISVLSRNTQGVRLISLDDGDQLVGVERIEAFDDNGDAEDSDAE